MLDSIHVGADCAVTYVAWAQDGAGLVVSCNKPGGKSYELRKIDISQRHHSGGPTFHRRQGYGGQAVWAADGAEAVPPGKSEDDTAAVDIATKESHVVFRNEGRIRDVTPLKDGRVIFRAVSEGMGKLMILTPDGDPEPLDFGEGSTSLLAINEEKRLLYAVHTGIVTPKGLYEMNLDTRAARLLFQPSQVKGVRGIASQTVQLSVPTGPAFPIQVWKSETRPSRGVIIFFPNGRGDEKAPPVFSGYIQYFLWKGYDYIGFDFQPDGGDAINDLDIKCSLAVIDYACSQLGASSGKTVLYGGSRATVYVIETARRMREKAGVVVLRSVTRSSMNSESGFEHRFRIAVVQGENDPVTPAMAGRHVEGVFGPQSLSGANGFLYPLPHEGHTPRLLGSRALAYAAIIELLEL